MRPMETFRVEQNQHPVDVDILLGQLRKLEKADRLLVGLHFFEKLTIEEIALIMGLTPDEVQNHLDRIKPLLITTMTEDQATETISEMMS